MVKRMTMVSSIIFLFVAVVTICLISGVHLYLKTEHAHRLIHAEINRVINGELSWQDISVSLLGGTVEIQDAVLRGHDGGKLASFDSLYMNLSLAGLFQGRLVMEHV
ncbi:MAG TPA: hypothetical protein ENN05_06985, partial [Deltaproteobacteria bacterium]|nr:hypothetical protein [Deltaproteobacteria bacterium]